eukprot:g24670.t1
MCSTSVPPFSLLRLLEHLAMSILSLYVSAPLTWVPFAVCIVSLLSMVPARLMLGLPCGEDLVLKKLPRTCFFRVKEPEASVPLGDESCWIKKVTELSYRGFTIGHLLDFCQVLGSSSYQTKKAGHGGTRQMGPDPQIIRLALADIEKSMEASEVTMDVVNGKMMEIKGKMLQMGIPTPLQLNMTLDEYHQRLEKFGRMDGVPMTPSTKAPSSAARSSPSEVPSSPEPKKASQKKGVPPEGPLEKEIKEMAIKGYLAAKKEKELDVTKGTPQMIPDGPEVVMIHSEEEEWEAPTEKGKASGDP